ncbi:hypothetical protein BHE74_00050538 [Ensete ventricosum]|uniref:Uncharacterized protein n=1 Tax=Ensete ventricosum TaxID=4639 RepID=A0A426YVF0_ENSVE|nr:hypothetical protein B296_00038438 [Ensete ventricosum]RWW21813.1 hypothetical protein GW17_00014015 [Ensete ventricosum]RWW43766.1 hypothetical protein BHE74_00050538 [Ensete ventricosum]
MLAQRSPETMLLLELGICVIPLTLYLAPCRRVVHLVAKLQRLHASLMRSRATSPATWRRLPRIDSATVTL